MLDEALARGRAAYPELLLPAEDFAAHLLRHGAAEDPAAFDIEGLYLCCACARGVPGAAERFDRELLSRVPTFLSVATPSVILNWPESTGCFTVPDMSTFATSGPRAL